MCVRTCPMGALSLVEV
ncbi:MAG: hypothetical protein NOM71_06305 [Archaeoglobi archaeon]|nr:hypothetical protein [Archaeoglobi archaeon]